MTTAKEKMLSGEWYDAVGNPELTAELMACRDKIHELNRLHKGIEKALPITIGDNVWLGGNVTVLPGVSIGEGSVIGAGSVVTRDVPPHAVAAGNPARILRWL